MLEKIRHAWNNPMDVLYFIQGCVHYAFFRVTGIIINSKKYFKKRRGAAECVQNGDCLECGCNMELVLFSSKPCPKRKSSPDKKPCY